MTGLFPCQTFQGFGTTVLDPGPDKTWHLIEGPKRSAIRSGVRQCCPKRPGVYGMIAADGHLLHVGKAKCLVIFGGGGVTRKRAEFWRGRRPLHGSIPPANSRP